jgi:hypothetical protein
MNAIQSTGWRARAQKQNARDAQQERKAKLNGDIYHRFQMHGG